MLLGTLSTPSEVVFTALESELPQRLLPVAMTKASVAIVVLLVVSRLDAASASPVSICSMRAFVVAVAWEESIGFCVTLEPLVELHPVTHRTAAPKNPLKPSCIRSFIDISL